MKSLQSLLLLAQGASFVLARNDIRDVCPVTTSTHYITVISTHYPTTPANPGHPQTSEHGSGGTVTETVTKSLPPVIITETCTETITETVPAGPKTNTKTDTGPAGPTIKTITETLTPGPTTETITETYTPGPKTSPPFTPIYMNTTTKKTKPNYISSKPSKITTGTAVSVITSSSVSGKPTTSRKSSGTQPLSTYKSSGTAPISSANVTSSVAPASTCADVCASAVAASTDLCALVFATTLYPSTVTQTVYTTSFPKNLTLSPTVSTQTLIDTLSFTDLTTSTDATIDVSTTVATQTITDSIVTILSTTGTTTMTAVTSATVVPKKRLVVTGPLASPTACTNVAQFSSACSCAGATTAIVSLPVPTVTVTSIINGTFTFTNNLTATYQSTISETTTLTSNVEITSTIDLTATFDTTATTTIDVLATSTTTPAASPSGNAYCSNGNSVNGLSASCSTQPCDTFNLRIEGASDTIYEGPIYTGPQVVTTPSGGSHLCDGTNNNANPSPAGNGISAIASAGGLCGFDYDGTFSNQFDDFFITRIGSTGSTGNEFWGILLDFAFTPAGGCETEPPAGSDLLWAFNAFNVNFFLDVSPKTSTVAVGSVIVFTVTGHDGNGDPGTPIAGASFNGATTNANGQVVFVATQPGTFRYKATRSDSIRSPAAIITVTA